MRKPYRFGNPLFKKITEEFESYNKDCEPVFINGIEGVEVDIILPVVLQESACAKMFFYEGYSSYMEHPTIRVRVNDLVSDLPDDAIGRALKKCNELNREYPSYMTASIDEDNNIYLAYNIPGYTKPENIGKIAFEIYIDTLHYLERNIESLVKSIFLDEAEDYYFENDYYYFDRSEREIKDVLSKWTVQHGYVIEDEWEYEDELYMNTMENCDAE